jgi:hypothetical protein
MTDPTRPLSAAEQWAKKLYDDLAFAAPELWPMHMTRRFEEALDAARSLPSVEALDRLRVLMNSLGIVGPNIRHAEWTPDLHMPEPWPGEGWCVCYRVLPCEAAEVDAILARLAEPAREPLDVEALRDALAPHHMAKDGSYLFVDSDLPALAARLTDQQEAGR